MLLIDILGYVRRRADKTPLYLKNQVDQSHHHDSSPQEPSVSIIIPTRDKVELLRSCIDSIVKNTTYRNYDVRVVDNQSIESETLRYLGELGERGFRILKYPHKFNYSAICNLAAKETRGEYLCFLNNDTEVIEPGWLGNLVEHATAKDVGIAGSLLLYPDGTIQHAGIALGYSGIAGHPYSGEAKEAIGAAGCYKVSASTFACVVISRSKFLEIGSLDERMPVGLNDVEFALRSADAGYTNLVCTRSILTHSESKSRKSMRTVSGASQALRDVLYLSSKHRSKIRTDPYFLR